MPRPTDSLDALSWLLDSPVPGAPRRPKPLRPAAPHRYVFGLRWDPAPGLFGWPGLCREVNLDAACVLLSAEGTIIESAHPRLTSGHHGALRHSGDSFDGAGAGDDEVVGVRPEKLRSHVAAVMFTVTRRSGEPLAGARQAVCRLYDMERGLVVAQADLTRLGEASGAVVAGLVRTPDGWLPRAFEATGRARSHTDLAHVMQRVLRHG